MPATITLTQAPQDYNLVVGSNVWTLDSITSSEDGYILEVQTYNEVTSTSTTIATIQQPANPAGVAHFDVSKILQAQMANYAFTEETLEASETAGALLTYRVRWGSTTDDVITINGTSSLKHVLNGYTNWRNLNWPDWNNYFTEPTSITCICETPPCALSATFTARPDYLHNYPNNAIPVRSSEYHTLSFPNRISNWNSGAQWGNNEQPWAVRIKFFDVNSNIIQTAIYVLSDTTGIGPRSTFDDDTIGAYKDGEWIATIGAGPQNLKDANYWPQSTPAFWNQVTQVWSNWAVIWQYATSTALVDTYTVDVLSVNMCYWADNGAPADDAATTLEPYLGQLIYTQDFQAADPCTGFDPITVSFVNQYGVKDYYTFDRRNTYNQGIKRNNYSQVLGSWSDATFSIDQHGRGQRTFSTQIETRMTMSSYWMNDAESKWLEELFSSPHIQVYYDGVWEPAVITSSRYSQKTNSRDGLFQHTLEIQFANNKKVQRG